MDDCLGTWHFETDGKTVSIELKFKGTVSYEFAVDTLKCAIEKKDKAVSYGDAISLDMLIAGLKKETINDLGNVLKKAKM